MCTDDILHDRNGSLITDYIVRTLVAWHALLTIVLVMVCVLDEFSELEVCGVCIWYYTVFQPMPAYVDRVYCGQ